MEKFNFNFSKPEDQKKFEKLDPIEKEKIIEDVNQEASQIKKYAHEFFDGSNEPEGKHYSAGELAFNQERKEDSNMTGLYKTFMFYGINCDPIKEFSNFADFGEHLSKEGYSEKTILNLHAEIRGISEAIYQSENYYISFKLFKFLGMEDRIKARVFQSIRYSGREYENMASFDLFRGVCEFGNEQQIRKATHEYLSEKDTSPTGLEGIEFFEKRISEVHAYITDYCRRNKIPLTQPIDHKEINAAGELLKGKYDLVISVIKSGTPIAALLEIAGAHVQYVEWHKHWTKGPKWCKIGGIQKRLEKAKKILLCEHDTHSGATLEALNPFLRKLDPESVDVNYLVDVHGTNLKYSQMIPNLRNVYNVKYDLPKENYYENLDLFLNLVRKEKSQLE